MLRSGIDGIMRELPLPAPAEEDLFQLDLRTRHFELLPGSLGEAISALQNLSLIHIYSYSWVPLRS